MKAILFTEQYYDPEGWGSAQLARDVTTQSASIQTAAATLVLRAAFPWLLFAGAALYVTQTNTPLVVPLTAIAAWLRRRPLAIVAQDIYPEVLFTHGMAATGRVPAKLLIGLWNTPAAGLQQESQKLHRRGQQPHHCLDHMCVPSTRGGALVLDS